MNSRVALVLVLFLACTASSCVIYQGYQRGLTESNEAYLSSSLTRMREAIKKYTSEKGRPPQTLEELSDQGYTYILPDPITHKADWVIVRYKCPVPARANCKEGIKDVHSASTARSSKGNLYSDW